MPAVNDLSFPTGAVAVADRRDRCPIIISADNEDARASPRRADS
jgi:hypothetical protein